MSSPHLGVAPVPAPGAAPVEVDATGVPVRRGPDPREAWRAAGGSRLARRSRLGAAALTLPAWLMVVAVLAVPIGIGVWLSFRNESLTSFVPSRFVGLDNYRKELTSPIFWEAFRTTLVMMLLGLAIQLPIGIGLAVLLHRNLAGTRLFRSTLLIPMLLTPVAVGLMWRFMLDTDLGVVNWFLETVGLPGVNWLGSRPTAILSVVLVDSWQAIPFVMLLVLAGLAGLPDGPLEAARVDGASGWQTFWFVTAPMLRPVIYVVVMIRVIDAFKLFDVIFILTRGGPGTATQTLGLLTYNTGFNFLQTSRAAALGTALALLTIPVYLLWRLAARAGRG